MQDSTEQRVRQRLRQVRWPGFAVDVVAAGFIRGIAVQGGRVTIDLRPETRSEAKVAAIEEEIRKRVGALADVEHVVVRRTLPVLDPVLREGGAMTPLQAELGEAAVVPDPDPVLEASARWDGRRPGRGGRPSDCTYTGELPVCQWEIDPAHPTGRSGEAHLILGDWEYRLWWQAHPAGLVYASMQAIEDDTADHGRAARPHPVGRAVAVNLVYDERRDAIIAIYGTAQDFRPFIEAFRRGFGWSPGAARAHQSEGETG